jgi:hypothetical protein
VDANFVPGLPIDQERQALFDDKSFFLDPIVVAEAAKTIGIQDYNPTDYESLSMELNISVDDIGVTFQNPTGHLNRVRQYIPNCAMRACLGLENSSGPVEKANDLVVAKRQKHDGMAWSKEGSTGLASVSSACLKVRLNRVSGMARFHSGQFLFWIGQPSCFQLHRWKLFGKNTWARGLSQIWSQHCPFCRLLD